MLKDVNDEQVLTSYVVTLVTRHYTEDIYVMAEHKNKILENKKN